MYTHKATMKAKEMIKELESDGLSQASIAKGASVTQATISRIASGSVEDPRTSTHKAIEKFYNGLKGVELA